MAPRPHLRRGRQLLAGTASVALALLAFASVVSAHTGKPSSISVSVSSLTVQASGNWTWPGETTTKRPSFIGYAVSWGDVTSGNAIGPYHIGDGTAATNVVLQPTSPASGTSGVWGPISHTYAAPGTYMACVIIYDLGEVKPFKTTGWHSMTAGGTGRNGDNSVENISGGGGGASGGAQCATVQVTGATETPAATPTPAASTPAASTPVATPTPFESFAGETSGPGPTSTPPPTSTLPSGGSDGNGPALPLILLALSSILGVAALAPMRIKRR